MNLWRQVIYALLFFGFSFPLKAQTVKPVEVSGTVPYVEHISLEAGSSDMELLVKLSFDEPENRLTVSLISYRKLFVFQADVSYSYAVRWSRLRPSRLPYVVSSEEGAQYIMDRSLKRTLHPKRKHVFNRWIAYEGLQPQPVDYRMDNEYIEQTFDIPHQGSEVSVTLRDILVMDCETSGKKWRYDMLYQTDLNRRYEITLKRDPCFGKEEAIAESAAQLENIRSGFTAFSQKFGEDAPSAFHNREGVKIFEEMKALLLEQYPRQEDSSACPVLQSHIEAYNRYVDSIHRMQFRFEEQPVRSHPEEVALTLSADDILTSARRIDSQVNRWLLTSDKIEKRDLENSCEQIIERIRSEVRSATLINSSQKAALAVFYEAENYFSQTCKR